MHELAITNSILDIVLKEAEKAEAQRVGRITMVIGEMTGVVADSVQFYFDFLSKGTPAEEATLSFRMVPIKAQCRSCSKLFETRELDWICPDCGGNSLEIIAGKELFVESIEVE